jgi:hypothetical protein
MAIYHTESTFAVAAVLAVIKCNLNEHEVALAAILAGIDHNKVNCIDSALDIMILFSPMPPSPSSSSLPCPASFVLFKHGGGELASVTLPVLAMTQIPLWRQET